MKEQVFLLLLGQVAILQSASVPVQKKCDCAATVMTCSQKQLTSIPQCHVASSVDILDVSYNHLRVIPNNSFANFPNAKNILLNNAHVTWLEPEAFQGVPLLEKVDLSNNYIDYVQPNTFVSNTNLHTVILSSNLLQMSQDEPILVSSSVATLKLSECQIEHMSTTILSALPGLRTLDLSHNSLTYLPPDTFTGLVNLTVINVSNNEWRCDDNFTTMMCWMHERGQQALVPVSCYDNQHNRRKWTAKSCMSVTRTSVAWTNQHDTASYSAAPTEQPQTEVAWTNQHDTASYSAAPTEVTSTVLNVAVTTPQSDKARQPSDTTDTEANWLYSKTLSFLEATVLAIMLVVSVLGGIVTARFILKCMKPPEQHVYEEIPHQCGILKIIRVVCFSPESR